MKKISVLVGKKILVAVFLVAILVGSGAYALALNGKGKTAQGPQNIVVSQGPAASIDYRMYDMFQEPWGEWWATRTTFYSTDFLITSDPGMNTMLFMPGKSPQLSYQGLIYAPYRYSIDAVDVTTINVSHPEFMPVLGTPAAGATAGINVYFQYIYQQWWDQYWVPTWGGESTWVGDLWNIRGSADGYDLGTVYEVTMNREAAQLWMGLPTSESDPDAWWAANAAAYKTSWVNWILNEGNNRLDIWCGYEWPYDINGGTWMALRVDGFGNIILDIGHLVLGYEILMDRWLEETQISPGLQPYWEDFSMSVSYGETSADYASDGVCQYSLHAVKGNKTADHAAWVWEPAKIDYTTRGVHPSDYKWWAGKDYQSWNAGDVFLGQNVLYEQAPNWFNLTEGQTLTIEAPPGVAPAFSGVALTETDYDDLATGDATGFYNIMDNGTLGLGYWITGWPEASGLDLTDMYNPMSKTLTIQGPQNFTNFVHTGDILYHGTPWIEFWVDHTGPAANAGTDMNNIVTETPVSFDGSGSSDDVRVFNYTWTFTHQGSPMTLYGLSPDFSFMELGDYTVTLTVVDSVGNVDSDDVIVHVTILIPEFPMILVPIAATLAMIAVFKKRKR
ncbi:MAG: hypothetical protein A3K60_01845 [Euryarchaeota archaeon RBG_19FT_COMBO_56_21]|nr:MAG: hypothetical protein A3K60_01845 [Euryarchaeota archaeon RBG_19FT_COMBO_56_21]